jgi:hypothetical protein
MNVTDLRDILDERSHAARIPAGLERMAGVRARVSAIRQRRVAAIGALAVVTLVIIGYGLTRPHAPHAGLAAVHPTASPSFGYHLVNGFPEYADGAKVVATGSASTRVGVIRVTAAAAELGFVFATRCQVPDGVELSLNWTANGNKIVEGTCGGSFRTDPGMWQSPGTRAGDRVEFVVTIVAVQPGPSSGPVPDGTFSVAVMRRLDYAAYPLPPRPARLAPLAKNPAAGLDPRVGQATGKVIDSVPADPKAPVEIKIPVAANAALDMVAQTPGYLLVYADGLLQARAEWWDYEQLVYGASLRAGEQGSRTVTVRLVPEHMTGAWRAVLYSGQT